MLQMLFLYVVGAVVLCAGAAESANSVAGAGAVQYAYAYAFCVINLCWCCTV